MKNYAVIFICGPTALNLVYLKLKIVSLLFSYLFGFAKINEMIFAHE